MSSHRLLLAAAALTWASTAASAVPASSGRPPGLAALDSAAEAYVKLVLAGGVHDELLVDSYFGPPAWRQEAVRAAVPLPELVRRIDQLLGSLPSTSSASGPLVRWRDRFLRGQLGALRTRLEQVGGQPMSFEYQALTFYGVWPTRHTEEEFQRWHRELEPLLPGPGSLAERAAAQRERYLIPAEKLVALFEAGAAECRRRTRARMALPDDEQVTVEVVGDQPWWANARRVDGAHTHLEIDIDAPYELSDAIDYPCHEGHPGRHLQGLLSGQVAQAQRLVELLVLQTFSPAGLLAEGHASVAPDLALPLEERVAFTRGVLFPLVGLDPADADRYVRSRLALGRLYYAAQAAVAELLLDGALDEAGAIALMEAQALCSRKVAEDTVRFIRAMGAYVVGYDLGRTLVERHLDLRGGQDPQARWRAFEQLWGPAALPADLAADVR